MKELLGELELNRIYQRDCLAEDGMKLIPDKSVDLICIDPPYNIGKDKWDKWKTVEEYVNWMVDVFKECERILKPNGSFYWFHNDMTQIWRLMQSIELETNFTYKQFIVWNKRFEGASNKGFLDGFVEIGGLRNYQQMAEYCLFYTLQDELKHIKEFDDLRSYLREESIKAFGHINGMNTFLGFAEKGGMATRKYLGKTQFYLPTREHYEKLRTTGYFKREYEDLVKDYESKRYTYNNLKRNHSVWNYEIASKQGHITPKPVNMIENIILHSSNEGDVVFDCFIGSGTTAIAATKLNRRWIGFERETKYIEIANKRLEQIEIHTDLNKL
ncbi:DNA-methyltransferase [Priestia flexa]|uniref:DNA-methyltransferase n=1 Tax=Priestia flexa TaxID=86664 RepID=UPI0004734369|nr:site-specific DNA-methyltransferase [Priestia flexa]